MLISSDDQRSLTACRSAEREVFQIPASGRASSCLEYRESVRAEPPWNGVTDVDSHPEPASAGSCRAEMTKARSWPKPGITSSRRR
jgi:hypothetical protein